VAPAAGGARGPAFGTGRARAQFLTEAGRLQTAAIATSAQGSLPLVGDKDRESRLLGRLEVAQAGTVFRLTGRMSSLMIGMIASQIP
jgi:hypothetical protein